MADATVQAQEIAKNVGVRNRQTHQKNRETLHKAQIGTARTCSGGSDKQNADCGNHSAAFASRTKTTRKQKEKAIMEKPRRHKSSNRATGKGRADREIPHRTGKGRADLSAGKQYTEPGIGAPRGCHNRRTPH